MRSPPAQPNHFLLTAYPAAEGSAPAAADPRRAKDADHYQGDPPPPNLNGKRATRQARPLPQYPRRAKDADHYQGDPPPPNPNGKRATRRAVIPRDTVDGLQRELAGKLDKQAHLLALNGSSTRQATLTLARAERTWTEHAAQAAASTLENERCLSKASDAPDRARLKRPRACDGGEDSGDRCLPRRV